MLMRSALRSAVARLDPDGRDPALRRMVLIGHSQGGLLVKMQAIRSGSRFWDRISRRPLDEMSLSAETREVFRQALFVEPAPFVGRVVFISTPHRGSFVAGRPMLGTLVRAVVSFPARVLAIAAELAAQRAALAEALLGEPEVSSAVDNMSPRHLFIQTLQTIPVADEVPAHSIISVAAPARSRRATTAWWRTRARTCRAWIPSAWCGRVTRRRDIRRRSPRYTGSCCCTRRRPGERVTRAKNVLAFDPRVDVHRSSP